MLIIQLSPGPRTLQDWGPVLPVTLTGPGGTIQTQAMVDTGSSMSSVDEGLLAQIGVQPCGSTDVETVAGVVAIHLYTATISTADGRHLVGGSCKVLGNRLPGEPQVLLGRDVLAGLRFAYDGVAGSWSLDTAGGAAAPVPELSVWSIAAGSLVGSVVGWAATAALRRLFRQQ